MIKADIKREKVMWKKMTQFTVFLSLFLMSSLIIADEDSRQLVELPEMMQRHMMSNMRDHLKTINEILIHLSNNKMDKAASIAEHRIGMSSLDSHGASHMGKFMPKGMRQAGTNMHKAASRFALKAEEGELLPAYKMLSEVTSTCVACHSNYRIK
jgi:hypothetical protein